mmetsp:Transcript_28983/g.88884  ORF Transcript_28983/g.88884 Transcript_28983/m.88884 type:complete len:122 (+) Transcript_28983:837-1202(+)
MTNIHILNLPLALVNTMIGDGARLFRSADLYASYVIVALYSILYLFCLDRLGLHFYPMFTARSNTCALSFGLLLALYYCILTGANRVISSSSNLPRWETESLDVEIAPLVFLKAIATALFT